jgi:hypothetical protein
MVNNCQNWGAMSQVYILYQHKYIFKTVIKSIWKVSLLVHSPAAKQWSKQNKLKIHWSMEESVVNVSQTDMYVK